MKRRALLTSAALAGVLAACRDTNPAASGPAPAPPVEDPEPSIRNKPAQRVDPEELTLPLEMTPMIIVDPGWSSTPQQLDGIFAGYRDREDRLTYVVVEQDGTVLWEADRPLSCTGFTLTRGPDDRAVAVLADLAPSKDAVAAMTLTGYDLRTAEPLWGPVEAPGPQAALGLVYAEPTDEPMGPGGSRTALAGGSGAVASAEAEPGSGRILAEHLGTIVSVDDTELIATNSDGKRLWRRDLPAQWQTDRITVVGTIDTDTAYAVLTDQDAAGIVVDLASGAEVVSDAYAVEYDHVNDITVVASGKTVRGLDAEGVEQWRHEDTDQLDLISAGERLAYAVRRDEGTLVVLDTLQGIMVQPYDVDSTAPLAMPEIFSADTAAAVQAGSRRYLVTTEFDENYGTRE